MAFYPLQTKDFRLAGSGCSASDTSITVQAFYLLLPDGITQVPITMSMLGDIGYATIEPLGQKEENITFTGVTQNPNGTATLTGVTRGVKFQSPYNSDVAYATSHGGGVVLRLTNSSVFYNEFAIKQNDEVISGDWDFSTISPEVPTMSSSDITRAASIEYVNNTAISGAPAASNITPGIVKIATNSQAFFGEPDTDGTYYFLATMNQQKDGSHQQRTNSFQYGETISYGEIVYLNTADSKWYIASATSSATADGVYGICAQAGVLNDYGMVMLSGSQIDGLVGLTPGIQYLSDTAGAISSTPGTYKKVIGFAPTATSLFFIPVQRVEDLAGTNSFVTTSKLNQLAQMNIPTISMTAGENISAASSPKAVFIEDGFYAPYELFSQTTVNAANNIFGANYYGQSFTPGVNYLDSVYVRIRRTIADITGNITYALYATDGSGFPTGSALWSLMEDADTVQRNGTGYKRLDINLSISNSATYALVISVPSATGAGGDLIEWARNSSGGLSGGTAIVSTNSGATWSNGTGDFCIKIWGYDSLTTGRIYTSNPSNRNRMYIDGFINENVTAGNQAVVTTGGIVGGFSGLSVGQMYFIDSNGSLTTTPSVLQVGRAVSATELDFETIKSNTIVNSGETDYFGTQDTGGTTFTTDLVREYIDAKRLTNLKGFRATFDCLSSISSGGNVNFSFSFGGTQITEVTQTSDGFISRFSIECFNESTSEQRWIITMIQSNDNITLLNQTTTINTNNMSEFLITTSTTTSTGNAASGRLNNCLMYYFD